MKEAMIHYLNERINYHKLEQARLKKADCADEAAHQQICINVYSIFQSIYQAVKYDLGETLRRFAGIVETWDQQHRLAHEHRNTEQQLIEEIKIGRALEIIRFAKELEVPHHD